MSIPIRFVVTVTGGGKVWDCEVPDPAKKPITWAYIRKKMAEDPKCPFKTGQTLNIKSNWQKETR